MMCRIRWIQDGQELSTPDPNSNRCQEAMHAARYKREPLSKDERYALAEMAEAFSLLVAHPAGTEAMIRKLRLIRRALRDKYERHTTKLEEPNQ
jgi:hypothetical protein